MFKAYTKEFIMTTNKLIPCRKCEKSKQLYDFYLSTINKGGNIGECKCCVRSRVRLSHQAIHRRAYYTSDDFKRIHARGFQNYAKQYPAKVNARQLVKKAIRHGDLVRPANCECCNVSDVMIEAHHSNYDKPLDVNWLCKSCHCDWHNNKTVGD